MKNRRESMEKLEKEQQDFNEEPVEYCSHCLSLAIRDINGQPYCDKCGSTEIKSTDIYNWEDIYIKKYGKSFINKG